jgi:N-acyl-D-amino-acid deacylase
MFDVLIRNGMVVDGTGKPRFRADVAVNGARIVEVGMMQGARATEMIDASGLIVCPGLIDTHVHGDAMLLADPAHEPAVRQGITTYIIGQDGSSYAPGDRAVVDYFRHYTAGFNGNPDIGWDWNGVDDYLNRFNDRVAINVAYLVPNGNVRLQAMGMADRAANADEIRAMRKLVRSAMEQGAVGLSSGLDYIPSRYATTEELVELCHEIAPFGGVYVTHMRSYTPEGVFEAMDEVSRIGREAKVGVHISHFNGRAAQVLPRVDQDRAAGIDLTFDLYPYLAGSSILAMVALPPWVQEGGNEATLNRLRDPAVRARLADWFKQPKYAHADLKLSAIAAPEYRHLEGKMLLEAAKAVGEAPGEFICKVLAASDLMVGIVHFHRGRGDSDIFAMMRHPGHMAGSDGIFVGSCPHPRGWGAFARYLGRYVRDDRQWSLEDAVYHLSGHAAQRFGLSDRGHIAPGKVADIITFDHQRLTDRATFEHGRQCALGVEDVMVNGRCVLRQGVRTPARPGRGLRRVT